MDCRPAMPGNCNVARHVLQADLLFNCAAEDAGYV